MTETRGPESESRRCHQVGGRRDGIMLPRTPVRTVAPVFPARRMIHMSTATATPSARRAPPKGIRTGIYSSIGKRSHPCRKGTLL
jgi:hypothetical protein